MSGYVSERHDPPQVLTVVAITCRQCGGEETFHDEDGRLCACHSCEAGYEKVMVPVLGLLGIIENVDRAWMGWRAQIHHEVVRLAEDRPVRLPVLTHCTSQLPVHLHPVKPRIPLQRIVDPIIITDKLEK